MTETALRVDVVTMWYNEAFLAPFFLEHYRFADTIHLLYDEDTTDNTLDVVARYRNVRVVPFRFPDKFDDAIKVDMTNRLCGSLDCDWVIAVDSDEFVFALPIGVDIRQVLKEEMSYDLVFAQLWQVYRHHDDRDLDPTLPAVGQRRHGDPNVTTGKNALYVKPIVVRPSAGIEWQPGCHHLKLGGRFSRGIRKLLGLGLSVSPRRLSGVHWALADPEFAVERRIKGRRDRMSKNNVAQGMSVHLQKITEESIREECRQHLGDPLLF